MKRTSPLVAVVASLALALAACADDDTDGVADEPPAEPADDANDEAADEAADDTDDAEVQDEAIEADDDETDEASTGDAVVVAVETTDLGEILVDGDGMTLYMFDVDEQGGASQCADDCAANWPPLTTEGDPAAEGEADDALLATIERDDGSVQVTYDGWPLYHFIGDQAAGDVAGQAVNDVWWVLDASGTPVRDAEPDDAATDDADDANAGGVGSGY